MTRTELEETLASWIAHAAHEGRAAGSRALCVGVCAPQGAGKTTLCAKLEQLLASRGLRAASVSIDDVYLTRDEQLALAARHAGNRYLAVRGYPGTHDVGLGLRVLTHLAGLAEGDAFAVPRYDKGAHSGAGDRAPREAWTEVYGPVDVVLFEGWMLAYEPVTERFLPPDDAFATCNELLATYAPWRARVDRWVVLEGDEVEHVVAWRVGAERERRARDGRGMSDEDATAYIERFLPAYRVWSPRLVERLGVPSAHVVIDARRSPLALTFRDERRRAGSWGR
jgi:D-glycerate 3-kinase